MEPKLPWLLPCRYCGSAPRMRIESGRTRTVSCESANCPVNPEVYGPTPRGARRIWNRNQAETNSPPLSGERLPGHLPECGFEKPEPERGLPNISGALRKWRAAHSATAEQK